MAKKQSKRYRAMAEKTSKQPVELPEAVKRVKELASGTKFDQSIELVMNLGIDPKQADQMVRGAVSLPKGIGASKRVIVFCQDDQIEQAKEAGAVEAGADDLVKKIQDGWLDFDVAIASPKMMPKVGRLGRVLGPQGKMPSPKSGTVTPDVVTAVKEFAAGKLEFRNDDGGNIHAVVGKASFEPEDLQANIEAFITHIRHLKPSAAKGHFINKVALSGTMSPSVILAVS